jgi:methionyl-tRNA formyltransferase
MKIQILISKTSWANKCKSTILAKLKKYSKKLEILQSHKKLKKGYDINIIFSYFKIIPKKYLLKSKINLIPHESNLPHGRGMSPISWQILENKQKIYFSLIEADQQIDSGKIYYTKKISIPKHFLFDEIKKTQLNTNLKLIERFIIHYTKKLTTPKSTKQSGKVSFYKRRNPKDSEIDIKKSIEKQFNLLRIADNQNYPTFFKIHGKKFFLKINK